MKKLLKIKIKNITITFVSQYSTSADFSLLFFAVQQELQKVQEAIF